VIVLSMALFVFMASIIFLDDELIQLVIGAIGVLVTCWFILYARPIEQIKKELLYTCNTAQYNGYEYSDGEFFCVNNNGERVSARAVYDAREKYIQMVIKETE